jgi:hypothetical protein
VCRGQLTGGLPPRKSRLCCAHTAKAPDDAGASLAALTLSITLCVFAADQDRRAPGRAAQGNQVLARSE